MGLLGALVVMTGCGISTEGLYPEGDEGVETYLTEPPEVSWTGGQEDEPPEAHDDPESTDPEGGDPTPTPTPEEESTPTPIPTPPPLPPKDANDPDWLDTTLLLHMNGLDGSTTLLDHSNANNLISVVSKGNAVLQTSDKKFGSAALYLDGQGDNVQVYTNDGSVTGSQEWDLGTGDFTMEFWVYLMGTETQRPLLLRSRYSTVQGMNPGVQPWRVGWIGVNNFEFFASSGSTQGYNIAQGVSMGPIVRNQWVHLAVTRQGNMYRTFQNGVMISSFYSNKTVYHAGGHALSLGWANCDNSSQGGVFAPASYIDDVRITKGVARYTGSFSVPTAEFGDTN